MNKACIQTSDDLTIPMNSYLEMAKIFRNEIIELNFSSFNPSDLSNSSAVTRIICSNDKANEGEVIDVLHAYVLPGKMQWPTALPNKQISAPSKGVYLHRVCDPNQGRIARTMELLRNGESVEWFGLSGIG